MCFENLNFLIWFLSGHYISDVYDIKKQAWFTYNDLEVSKIQEASVQSDRDRSGYIFFYMHKWETSRYEARAEKVTQLFLLPWRIKCFCHLIDW